MFENTSDTCKSIGTDETAWKKSRLVKLKRTAVGLGVPIALLAAGLTTATAAHAYGIPGEVVTTWSTGQLNWTVPAMTHSVTLTVVGGAGASGHGSGQSASGGTAGHGGVVRETVAVTPGQVLTLSPGSAATSGGAVHSFGARLGGRRGFSGGSVGGDGGAGGAASAVTRGAQTLAVAGGGGGGGGGGAVYSYAGGNGGDAQHDGTSGSGAGAGSAGSGNIAADATYQDGEDATDAPLPSYAGGGGGGGAGWNGAGIGGGRAGASGTWGGGGGGGAAGGQSYGVSSNATYSIDSVIEDGYIVVDWTPNVATTSVLTAPASVPQGRPITFTDNVTPSLPSGPAATGTVTFEAVDYYTYVRTVLGTASVINNVASFTATALPSSTVGIHAIYTGDSTYETSTSDFVYPTITAPIKTVSVSPSVLAFGNVAKGTKVTKQVTLTNTGSTNWAWSSASTDNADVNMPATTCSNLDPGKSCTVSISYQPSVLGAITAHITMSSNFGDIVMTVTGTGITPAPVVTAVSPSSGPKAGGTRVTITGKNFVNVTKITIGGNAMTAVSCASQTTCTGTSPAGTVGLHDLHVVTPAGTSAAVTADRFSYV